MQLRATTKEAITWSRPWRSHGYEVLATSFSYPLAKYEDVYLVHSLAISSSNQQCTLYIQCSHYSWVA